MRRLARLLDHAVEVRSWPGEGSVFSVLVPLTGAARHPVPAGAAAEDTRTNATTGHGRLALAVDDDAIVLRGLKDILVDAGYEVLSAMSAAEAVQLLKRAGRTPDIVVSDYRLRDGQVGTECIGHIRAFLGRAGAWLLCIIYL